MPARIRPLALVALVLAALTAQAQSVRGFVSDAERGPLAGASVALQRIDADAGLQGAVTDAQGFYEVTLSPGRYAARATYVGYVAAFDTLAVGDGPTTWSPVLAAGEALDEVVVRADGGAADVSGGLQRIRPADLARVPTPDVAGDLATYLQSLPGVVSLGDRGGGLFVRGGTPSQNLVLVDGAPIYQPFHLLGFFSAFPEDLVSSVDFYAGGYGAKYTGRVSSVLDISLRDGSTEHVVASASLGPFVAGVQAEGPIRAGVSSWLVSTRGSVIEPIAETLLGRPVPLRFVDAIAKLATTGPTSRCTATLLGTYDRGTLDAAEDDAYVYRNGVLAGRCLVFPPGAAGRFEVQASLSHLGSEVGAPAQAGRGALAAGDRDRASSLTEVRFGAVLRRPVRGIMLEYGVQASTYATSYRLGESFASVREQGALILGAAAHVEAEIPLGTVRVTPGLAVSLQPYSFSTVLEPRFRAEWAPAGAAGPQVAFAGGLYRQSLVGLVDERDAGSPFIAWAGPPEGEAETSARHAVLGGSLPLGGGVRVGAEGYAKRVRDLPVPIWTSRAEFTTTLTQATATSVGADARVEYTSDAVYAYLGYGLGRTEYETAQALYRTLFGELAQRYAPAHDRRHQVQFTVQVRRGDSDLAVRWQFGSGLPYTRPYGFDTFVPPLGIPEVTEEPGVRRVLFERPFNGRLPMFHRLDVSAGTEISVGARAAIDLRAGALNVYNRDNLLYYDVFQGRRVDQLPLVPYVSARFRTR